MRLATVILAILAVMPSPAQDAREFSEAYEQGRKMSADDAGRLEKMLAARPDNILDRVRLVAFYTLAPESPVPEVAVRSRRSHLLWMAEHQPESWLWSQRSYGSAVYLKGDRLADPEGFSVIRDQWLKHLSRDDVTERIRMNAVSFLELGDRELSLRLVRDMQKPRYLGTLYALLLLGVIARDYDTGTPLTADPAVRESALAAQLLSELENSSDAQLIGGAGFSLARDGAMLWSQGELDWDYSPLAKTLLARARAIEPNQLDWLLANPNLPQPGERRAMMSLRIGGKAMASTNLRKILPKVPSQLRGVRGTVSLEVVVDGEGKVIHAMPRGGPPELYDISVEAVKQWLYKPTTVKGNPAIVITQVELNYK